MLLIITNQQDFAVDYTALRLEERGVPFFRLNSEELPRHSYVFELTKTGSRRVIETPQHVVDLAEVASVWYRRLIAPPRNAEVKPELQAYAQGEVRAYVEGLVVDHRARWVNPQLATTVAERKLFQLRIAHEHGFNVPRTWSTNSATAVRSAVATGLPLVVKPILHGLLTVPEGQRAVYTRRLRPDEQLLADDIVSCPSLLQEEIPRGADLRLTFFGLQAFGVEVAWDSAAAVDWRSPEAAATFHEYAIPDAVSERCVRMMRSLDLSYAAFDFILSAGGEYYFLELNPAGEFAWLEEALGFPMRDALIDLLLRRHP